MRTLLFLSALSLLTACSNEDQRTLAADGAGTGFHVLLITLDTTRADHLGAYGDGQAATPVIDSLARTGLRFDDASTSAPTTLPAHSSLFTGRYPFEHGARNNGDSVLAPELETLAESLQSAGYQTAGFPSALVLDARYGVAQGFDHYDGDYGREAASESFGGKLERTAGEVTDSALGWLRDSASTQPFFMWVHYYDPHYPYTPPREIGIQFRDRLYDGEIAYVDTQIGRLLDGLEQRGVRDETLVVIVGDHGQGLGEHGEDRHGCLIYDSVMRVPLILHAQGLLPARVIDDRVVSIVDVFPTLIELLGIQTRARVDGVSLLRSDADPKRAVYMESLLPLRNHGWAPLFGLRRKQDKFILAPAPEYYDLTGDPGELENLLETRRDDARELERELLKMLGGPPRIPALLETGQALDATTSAELAALGYGGGELAPDEVGTLDPKDVIAVAQLVDESRILLSRARGPQRSTHLKNAHDLAVRALGLSPQDREALQQLARVHISAGNYAQAEDALRRFLAIKPSADVFVTLAQVLIATERHAEAQSLLQAAEDLEPTHGGIFLARGHSLKAQGLFDAAIVQYEKARAVDPNRATGRAAESIREALEEKAAE